MDKSQLRRSLLAKLQDELELLTRAALMARDEATSEESKAENKYDTRGQEAAYLAEGQARLARELEETIAIYHGLAFPEADEGEAIGIGHVVTLEAGARRAHYLLGPRNGGLEIDLDGTTVIVVTPQSPLGRQLAGKRAGETVLLPGRGGNVPHRIAAVL
jgi:transcription elongation GreA/GreB family factor